MRPFWLLALAAISLLQGSYPLVVSAQSVPSPTTYARRPAGGRSITGTVRDARSGLPLASANVLLLPAPAELIEAGTEFGMATDRSGHFAFHDLPAGSYLLRVSFIGYRAYEVPESRRYPPAGKTPTKIVGLKGRFAMFGELLSAVSGRLNP